MELKVIRFDSIEQATDWSRSKSFNPEFINFEVADIDGPLCIIDSEERLNEDEKKLITFVEDTRLKL